MLKISIRSGNYRTPTHWEDVTLSQCAWLYNRVKELPAEVREYYLGFTSEQGPKMPEDIASLGAFSIEALEKLSGIPRWVLQKAGEQQMLRLSDIVLPRFVCGVMGHVEFNPSGARSFRRKGRKYHYPTSRADVMGRPMPMSGLCAAELCQVSDIVFSGNLSLAPLAIALCCRPRGEHYDEARAQRRTAEWGDLPASAYWELCTLVSSAHDYLRECFPECYGKSSGEGKGVASAWSDQLVGLAVGNPAALNSLQSMNGYDFVHLLCEHVKNKTEQWKMSAALSGLGVR